MYVAVNLVSAKTPCVFCLTYFINCILYLLILCVAASGISLDPIFRTLNRTILFQLSRPVGHVTGQAAVLDALHKLTSNRSLVFGKGNAFDQEFLGCLCFCLLQLVDDPVKRCVQYMWNGGAIILHQFIQSSMESKNSRRWGL